MIHYDGGVIVERRHEIVLEASVHEGRANSVRRNSRDRDRISSQSKHRNWLRPRSLAVAGSHALDARNRQDTKL